MNTRDEVLAMAREAGIKYRHTPVGTNEMWCYDDAILRFAALVAAAEREECAKDKVDAERYRFLRKQHEFDDDQASNNNYGKNYPPRTMCVFQDDGADGLEPVKCDPGALDEAIDRARSAK